MTWRLKGTCNVILNVRYRSHYNTLSLSPLNVVFTTSLAVYNDSKPTDSLPVASSIKICFSSIDYMKNLVSLNRSQRTLTLKMAAHSLNSLFIPLIFLDLIVRKTTYSEVIKTYRGRSCLHWILLDISIRVYHFQSPSSNEYPQGTVHLHRDSNIQVRYYITEHFYSELKYLYLRGMLR